MVLTEQEVRDNYQLLYNFSINSNLLPTFEKYGSYDDVQKKIVQLDASTKTLNQEFNDRHISMGDYYAPMFGTNQDIIILGFYFSYIFLVGVALFSIYYNTQSIERVIYGLLGSGFALFIITGILLRVA
jgi:hypothetical protein